jgi:hypothetical protein
MGYRSELAELREVILEERGQTMKAFSRFAGMLATELHRYLVDHPGKGRQIPRNALVIFQVAGEDAFNKWSQQVALRNREKGQPIVYVSVKGWRGRSALHAVHIRRKVA